MLPVSVIIPHYNNPENLRPCLESLGNRDRSAPHHEIVVVDDGSVDDSVAWIRKNFPQARVLKCAENRGFVSAIWEGVRNTAGEILVFLNNDTRVEPGWLKALLEPILSGDAVGATGSVLLDWEGKRALFKGGTVNYLGFGFEDQGDPPDPSGPSFPQLFVSGGAMAIARSQYLEAGGFDKGYGAIYEDVDLGWRLNLLGYECQMVPASRVYHRAHASLGAQSFAAKAAYYIGNSLRTIFKNSDEEEHLRRVELAVSLAQARERVCLLGETVAPGFLEGLARMFRPGGGSTPIVDALVREEERTRSLAARRADIRKRRKRSTRELFERFVPCPARRWYYDEEQNRLLEEKGYWAYERRMYEKYGLIQQSV